MKLFFTGILISLFCVGIFAQQTATVTGRLKDLGQIVPNQTVKLVSATETFEARTDSDGNYRFDGVADGRYLLVYGDKQASVTVKNGQAAAGELAEVVVVAANETQPLDQVSKTVDVIDGQEMRDRADFSLAESLRTVAGFRVQQLGGFGKAASIKSRGLRNQDTAILIDGIRFRDASAIAGDASSFLSDLTLTSVARVEVLRGPGSSLYGTNAAGGTVDFQTPTARAGTHGQVSAAIGGLGLKRFRGNVSHGTDGGKFGIGGAVSRTVYSKGIDGDDRAANTNFQGRVDAKPFDRTSFSGRFFYSRADVKLNSSPDTLGTLPASNATIIAARPSVNFVADANDPDNRQDSEFFSGQVTGSHAFSDRFVIAGFYQGLKTTRTNNNGPLGPGFQSASTSIFEGRIDTANTRFVWTPDGRNSLTAGYEYEREHFGNDGRTPTGSGNFSTRARQSSNALFVQHLLGLDDDRFQLGIGGRIQRYGLDRPTFSLANAPYASLTLKDPPTAYTFDASSSYYFRRTGTKLRAHVGSGYRVPSLYERFGTFFSTFGTPSFIAIGDPFLEPEKTIGLDAAVEQNAAAGRVTLSATYFYTKLTDIIGYGNVAPSIGTTTRPFGGYENQRGGIARGGEFAARFKPYAATEISTSYTFTNSDQRTPQVSGSRVTRTLGVPDHQFTLVATQRIGRAWVNFDFLATSTYLAPIFSNTTFTTYLYRFAGNRRGDLTAGYSFAMRRNTSVRIFGTVENVFDQEYYENGFRTAKANARLGVSYSF